MKKYLLTLIAVASITVLSAQVTIDWSTDAIELPTQINSNTTSGSTVNYKIVGKNNGTDNANIGDTLLFQIAITYTNNSPVVIAPSSSGFYLRVLNKNMSPGDTVQMVGTFGWPQYPYPSVNVNFIVISHIVNRSRGLAFEGSGTLTNNTKVKQMVWYNPQGWPVSVSNPNSGTAGIFPNLAKGKFTVELPATDISAATGIKIYDMMGRLVKYKEISAGENTATILIDDMPNGNYIVEVNGPSGKTSSKLVVQN